MQRISIGRFSSQSHNRLLYCFTQGPIENVMQARVSVRAILVLSATKVRWRKATTSHDSNIRGVLCSHVNFPYIVAIRHLRSTAPRRIAQHSSPSLVPFEQIHLIKIHSRSCCTSVPTSELSTFVVPHESLSHIQRLLCTSPWLALTRESLF